MRILLADKDPDVLDVTTYALRRYGFEVTAVRDGLQALRCWKDTAPDLVLAELDLPGMNGFELCAKLRTLPAHKKTPVIFVTSLNDFENRANSTMSGGNDFIAGQDHAGGLLWIKCAHILLMMSRWPSIVSPSCSVRPGGLM